MICTVSSAKCCLFDLVMNTTGVAMFLSILVLLPNSHAVPVPVTCLPALALCLIGERVAELQDLPVDIQSSNPSHRSLFQSSSSSTISIIELDRPRTRQQDVTGKVYPLCTGIVSPKSAKSCVIEADPSCESRACCGRQLELPPDLLPVLLLLEVSPKHFSAGHAPNNVLLAYATVESDIFKPTKYGGKYTVTLIPGT